ncbi:MAG TPA: hypothetical protein VN748_12855 [Pseudonocardiaceae bacterium]|nr:hypothetical protein [Pseudonocardiaceae bacterium]
MSVPRVLAGLLTMVLCAAGVTLSPLSPPAAAEDPTASSSAMTVSGKGDFADLKVTVSQTKNLVNQTITVSWTGGAPTIPDTSFRVNYLQIMQCWGDDPAGPDRTQCQFGGLAATPLANTSGTFVLSRQVFPGLDPEEKLQAVNGLGQAFVPFWAVGHDEPAGSGTGNINDFFDSQVTNEIPVARTHGDGTGEEFFEIETVTQAAGLGCGDPVTTGAVTKGRSCWLVIVPRDTKDADGSTRGGGSDQDALQYSPLSQSNWDHRIVVPLEFQPVGRACPIGAPERSLIGQELAVEAVSSWQPALCQGNGPLFSFTQLPDDVARSQVQNGGLALVTDPIAPDQVPADHPLVYAPVGLSGLTVAFDINYQPDLGHRTPDDLALAGRRFTSMKLTPRLVAKLLTQSYRRSLAVQVPELAKNPTGLLADPEFLDLNPDYRGFVDYLGNPVPDVLVQLNGADITTLLWRWVIADPDARAFLAGTPDKYGMLINPLNKGLSLPRSTFPRNDQSCVTSTDDGGNTVTNCNLDLRPYANDMHDAGRAASRGDTLTRQNTFDSNIKQQVSTKAARQVIGAQAVMAVVDAATAARYGLQTAQLLNAAGNYVAPTPDSLLASAAVMKPSAVPGVLAPDPAASDPNAYPLTSLSYAVTSPTMLDAAAGKDYTAFLRYAGGPGQQQGLAPGQLPPGMVPLPDALKAQTLAAATTVEKLINSLLAPPALTTTGGSPGSSATPGPGRDANPPYVPGQPPAGRSPVAPPAQVGPAPPATSVGKTPSVAQEPVAGIRRTPLLPAPWWVGLVLLLTLIVGGLAATSSPAIRLLGGRLARRLRKEVTPTER